MRLYIGTFWISIGTLSTLGGWRLVEGFWHDTHIATFFRVKTFRWNCKGVLGNDFCKE